MSLIDSLVTTPPLADVFSDRSVLQAMLDFEAALASAAASAGAIPDKAARVIAGAAHAAYFDAVEIAREARRSATPAIPLVTALTERVRAIDPDSATYVHWGATSQDVTDTAVVLLLQRALPLLAADHATLQRAIRGLSERHADSVMLGRTLLQPATPVTFGLKAAGWYASLGRAWRRLSGAWDEALVLQFGGASGTLASLGTSASTIAPQLARELNLRPAPPWHTDRDRLGALVAGCALYTAGLGKMARDLALLMQAEVAEAAEAGGVSSTMPHKRNPAACTLAIAAAVRMPGLAAGFLTGMVQEHERATGGSQAEWPTLAAVVQTTGSAVGAMAGAVEGLSVDPARMRLNLAATRGIVLAEQAMTLLTPRAGRDAARRIVAAAVERSQRADIPFGEAVGEVPEAARLLTPDELAQLDRPEDYLGAAEDIRRQLLRGEDQS